MKRLYQDRRHASAPATRYGWRGCTAALLIAGLLSACAPATLRPSPPAGAAPGPSGSAGWQATGSLPTKITLRRGPEWIEWSLSESGSRLRLRTDGGLHVGPVPWQGHREALEQLLALAESSEEQPIFLQAGPIQRLDAGAWASVLCDDSGNTASTSRPEGDESTSSNAAYVAKVRETGADREIQELFASLGYRSELVSVEKVFLRDRDAADGQPCAYDAGSHYFQLSPEMLTTRSNRER
jgi:hypothetical protein